MATEGALRALSGPSEALLGLTCDVQGRTRQIIWPWGSIAAVLGPLARGDPGRFLGGGPCDPNKQTC
eukprot:3794730-Pyramimonas_sp.AAC.1